MGLWDRPAAPGREEVSEKHSVWTCDSFPLQPRPITHHTPSLLHIVWKVDAELVTGCEQDGVPGNATSYPDVVEVREGAGGSSLLK